MTAPVSETLYIARKQENLVIDPNLLPSYFVTSPAFPGPGYYNPKFQDQHEKKLHIGEITPIRRQMEVPGPGKYNPQYKTQDISSQKITFNKITPLKNKEIAHPGPCDYTPLRKDKHEGTRMKYRVEIKNSR